MTSKTVSAITFGRLAAGISVGDIARACAFYCDVLGFRKSFENGDPVGFVILKKDAAELHLNLAKNARPSTVNAAHLLVDDVDALYAVCTAADVRIIKSLADKDYGLRAFVFADPDGNRIDVGQHIANRAAAEPGAQAPGANEPRRFEHRNMDETLFAHCSLSGAHFDDANLAGSLFSNVSLRDARFTDVNLAGVSIDNANITGLTIFGYDVQELIRAELARRKSG
jgi:uncharacterized protein YjbI with pentapeptide repeats